ncbi:hypothetical protein [Limisalsivibrio acetivorans]|uniref:hypothetical protein n=1 Tax=Limisalsivibrio acetivorans TaxID=1304888 RepID=UPI0003B699DD|nr:hypothetical protein [Limisalsivibrio acetivorans]
MNIRNNKGFSLVTTLVLSMVALAFISTLAYFVQSGSQTTASLGSYKSSLDVAKGTADFLIAGVRDNQVGCADNITKVTTFISRYDNETTTHDISVTNYECKSFDNDEKELYIFTIEVNRGANQEKSIVEFGYLEDFSS